MAGIRAPLVSVILPTRNRSHLLERAVASVLQQEVRLELIVVDDASSDDTPSVLRDLATRDGRVHPVTLAEPHGAAAARNVGIERASGAYVAFLDDDDEWLPGTLAPRVQALEEAAAVDVSYGPYFLDWGDGRDQLVRVEDISGDDPLRKLLRGAFVGTPSLLIRRSRLEQVGGFDPRLPRLQDWELCLRLARVGGFRYEPEPIFHAHFTPGGISRRDERLVEACRIIREKADGWPELDRRERADLDATLAHLLMVGNQRQEGRRYYRKALRLAPLRARRWILATLAHLWPRGYAMAVAAHGRIVEREWRRQRKGPA